MATANGSNGSRVPAITREIKELLEAVRVVGLSGRAPIDSAILGVCRRNGGGSIKKGKHVSKVVRENPDLFRVEPSLTPHGVRCKLIKLTSEGNKLLDMLEARNEVIHPVSLVRRERHLGAPTLYTLDAYYFDTGGFKRPLTMLFQGKLLFLEHGNFKAIPAYATEVVGEIKCLWKQCVGEVLNFQDPKPVETLPHIKHLIRYVVSNFRIDSMSSSSESELEYASLLTLKELFPGTKETQIRVGYDEVSILRIPVTKNKEVYLCKKCKETRCHHIARLHPHQ
nr:hypothetical protein [Candidatus Njordarchaeota archaeon]